MNISLKKSLAIFDIEATGLSITNDRIVEIAIVKIAPNGSRTDFLKRINPEIPIPKEVSELKVRFIRTFFLSSTSLSLYLSYEYKFKEVPCHF